MRSKMMYWLLSLLLLVSLGITFELPARAYTDPGSTLLLFQSLGAVMSGVLFYFRRHVKRLFTRTASSEPVASTSAMSRADS